MTATAARGVDKRRRIVDATLEVIVEYGFAGLSHRRVAKAAGVTLSATSYYFGTLEELLEAALIEAISRDQAALRAQLESLPSDAGPVETVAAIVDRLLSDTASGVLVTEFYVAGMRVERLQPLMRSWGEIWNDEFTNFLDDLTARTAHAVLSGLVQQGLVAKPRPTIEEITEVVRRGMDGPQ